MNQQVNLDDLLTLEECSAWFRLNKRDLAVKSRGKRPAVPGFWLNCKVVRFHPRTILAKLAHESGVPVEVIAASFQIKTNEHATKKPNATESH